MPENSLVHDPTKIDAETAIALSVGLGCPFVVHGLAPWMIEQGIQYGNDGYVVVVVCDVPEHNARKEVLATFKGGQITAKNIASVLSHAPVPDQRIIDIDTLQKIVSKPLMTQADLKAAIEIFTRRV